MDIIKKALNQFKEIKNENYHFMLPCYLLCFNSVESFIDMPTDEEYMTIAIVSYNIWLDIDVDGYDLVYIADKISELYANSMINLEQIKEINSIEILNHSIFPSGLS